MKQTFVAALCWVLMCGVARADIYCSGPITGLVVYGDGTVSLRGSWRNEFTFICGLKTSILNISTDTCKGWYSMMLAARARESQITVWYQNSASFNCANLPTFGDSISANFVGEGLL